MTSPTAHNRVCSRRGSELRARAVSRRLDLGPANLRAWARCPARFRQPQREHCRYTRPALRDHPLPRCDCRILAPATAPSLLRRDTRRTSAAQACQARARPSCRCRLSLALGQSARRNGRAWCPAVAVGTHSESRQPGNLAVSAGGSFGFVPIAEELFFSRLRRSSLSLLFDSLAAELGHQTLRVVRQGDVRAW